MEDCLLPTTPQLQARSGTVLLFNYRSLLDSAEFDRINFTAWQEVLDAFGYSHLTFDEFVKDLALKSAEEIMMGLCPMTTRVEWEPLLNKRTVRLEREIAQLCSVEVQAVNGLKDFIIDCAKAIPLQVVFLSSLSYDSSRTLLERADVSCFVDIVHCYQRREFAILDALEMLNVRPPKIPPRVHHRWEGEEGHLSATSSVIVFEADPEGVKYARALGLKTIGVSFNNAEDGEEKGELAASSVSSDAELLRAGASCVVKDFSSFKYEYLKHLH